MDRARHLIRLRRSATPALAVVPVVIAAIALYVFASTSTLGLPHCDADQIRHDVQTLISAANPDSALLSGSDSLGFRTFKEIDAAQFEGTTYRRTCATTVRIGERRLEIRFDIVKDAESAGYFIRLQDV